MDLIEEQLDEQGVSRVTYTELCAAHPRAERPAEPDANDSDQAEQADMLRAV